jgi:putative transposase
MIKAHKIRLNPTPEQANYFARAAGTARFTYNWAVAEWQRQSEAGGNPSALALRTQFNAIKKDQFPWVYEVTKCAVEGAFMDVAAAFKNFFEGRKAGRKTGFPCFKSKKRSRQSFYLANDKFTVEIPEEVPLNTHPPVGVDVGLNRLATLSDGRRYEYQRPLAQQLKKLRRLNKELARRTKGGKNWLKTKDKLGRLHYEIVCIRLDWLHKLTTQIAKTSGIVAVEDLHVKGLIRNRCLSRSFSDASVGKLLDLLASKVPRQGGMLLKVDRFFPSSQLCHCCGVRKNDLELSDRVCVCPDPDCGYLGDRDENAAYNLILEALRLFGLNVNMPSSRVATARRKTAWGPGVRPK